jgi:hypothetical protein
MAAARSPRGPQDIRAGLLRSSIGCSASSPGEAPRGATGGPPADAGPLSLPAVFLECSCCNARFRLTCSRSRSRADNTGCWSPPDLPAALFSPAMSFAGTPFPLFATRRPPAPLSACRFAAPATSEPGAMVSVGRTSLVATCPLSAWFHAAIHRNLPSAAHARKRGERTVSHRMRGAKSYFLKPPARAACALQPDGAQEQILLAHEKSPIRTRQLRQQRPSASASAATGSEMVTCMR